MPRVRLIAISASSLAVWHSEIDQFCCSMQNIILPLTSSQLYALGFRTYFCFVEGLKCAADVVLLRAFDPLLSIFNYWELKYLL
jgi:hypothetical protein